jgi:ABC-type polysaccharide/polyol phosphate export permease
MEIGLRDLREALARFPLALYFAWSDTKARYKRSVLGPFWLVLNTAIGVVGLGFVWSALLKANKTEFIPSLTIGLVVWQMLSGCLAEAPGIFYRQASQIKDINLPSFFISLQVVLRQLINAGHNFVVVIVIFIIFPGHISLTALLAIPGLIIVIVNLLWVTQLLGLIGARYRDLEPLVVAFLPILFFVSPVIYSAKQLGGDLEPLLLFNPLADWLGLIRDPIMGMTPTLGAYLYALAITAAGWLITLRTTSRKRHRLPYWI